MEKEKNPAQQEHISNELLHLELGEALRNNDTSTALNRLNQLKERLENDLKHDVPDIDAIDEGSESLEVDLIKEKIYDLPGTEFTIFGTARGLTVPLSAVMEDDRQLSGQDKDFHAYERGRNKTECEAGMRLFKQPDGRTSVEIVQHSRDFVNRFGFKGIEIVFPIEDQGLADIFTEDQETLHEAIIDIWNELGQHIPDDQRNYFVPE